MCNLYHVSPKGDIATHFRSVVPEAYVEGTVGPFQRGAFVRPQGDGLVCEWGQWGLIAPGSRTARPSSRAILTNNARVETVAERRTYAQAWARAQRCLIPAAWYQEPNWETGKNIWWRLQRADGRPWALAGLYAHWTDPNTGEIVPNYTLITCNCDGHPLLGRLHKPDPNLPPDAQDKRAVAHLEPEDWEAWLFGSEAEALALVRPSPADVFDPADVQRTDALLQARTSPPVAPQQGSLL
jgi:putative SOS response-associated peptidase YedK